MRELRRRVVARLERLRPVRHGVSDVRAAARLGVKSTLFTLAAVASLGLGVGANTTIFSLVNEVLLHPLPVHEASRLVSVFTTDAKNRERFQGFMATCYPNFRDYRE